MSDGSLRLLRLIRDMIDKFLENMTEPKSPVVSSKGGKLAIVVGHTSKSPGAKGVGIKSEWYFHNDRVPLILSAARERGVDAKVFYRPPELGYSAGLKSAYDQTDDWGADATVELHYNSSSSTSASGSEVLISTSKASKALGTYILDAQLKAFGLKNRGLVRRVRSGKRGWKSLFTGKAPAVLLEPGFGSNPADARSLEDNWPKFAELLVDAFVKWRNE